MDIRYLILDSAIDSASTHTRVLIVVSFLFSLAARRKMEVNAMRRKGCVASC